MQLARGSFGVTTLNNKVYAIAGHIGMSHDWKRSNYTAECEVFDLDTLTWSSIAPRPAAAEGFRSVGYGRYVYAFGGMTFDFRKSATSDSYQSTAQIDRYDTVTNTWTTLGNLPNPRSDYMLAQVGTMLYFIGGWNVSGLAGTSNPPLVEVDYFDLETEAFGDSGFRFPCDLKPRVGAVCLSWNGVGLIMGGVHHPDMFKQTTLFDPSPLAPVNWTDLSENAYLPLGLIDQTVFYVKELDRVWVLGGYSSGTNNSNLVYSAHVPDLISGAQFPWRIEPDMPQALMFFGVEEIRPGLVGILGGCCDPATSGPQTADFALYPLNMTNDEGQRATTPAAEAEAIAVPD